MLLQQCGCQFTELTNDYATRCTLNPCNQIKTRNQTLVLDRPRSIEINAIQSSTNPSKSAISQRLEEFVGLSGIKGFSGRVLAGNE
jgi:hypothetical protein